MGLIKHLQRILSVRAGEGALLLKFVLLFGVLNAVVDGTNVIATSDYVASLGTDSIPLVWGAQMVLLLLLSTLYGAVADRYHHDMVLRGLLIVFGCGFVLIRLLVSSSAVPGVITYNLLYVVVSIAYILFPLAFWAVANDHYTVASSGRLFPLVASAGLIGKIIGSWFAGVAATLFAAHGLGTNDLLLLFGALLFLLALQITWGFERPQALEVGVARIDMVESLKVGIEFMRDVPIFRYLGIVFAINQLVITILDYHYLVVGLARFPNTAEFAAFFGYLTALWNVLALILQVVVARELYNRLGPKNIFLLVPGFLLFGLSGATAFFGFASVVTVRFVQSVVTITLERPARKTVQGLIPDARRGRVSTFLDSHLFSLAQIAGCILLGAGILLRRGHVLGETPTAMLLLGIAAAASGVGLYFAWRLRNIYDSSLTNWRLARRKRSFSVQLDLDDS